MSGLPVGGNGAATLGVLLRRAAPVTGSDCPDVIVTPRVGGTPGTLGQVGRTTADVRVDRPVRTTGLEAARGRSKLPARWSLSAVGTAPELRSRLSRRYPESGRCRGL